MYVMFIKLFHPWIAYKLSFLLVLVLWWALSQYCLQSLRRFLVLFQTSALVPAYRSSSVCRQRSEKLSNAQEHKRFSSPRRRRSWSGIWALLGIFLILWEWLTVLLSRAEELFRTCKQSSVTRKGFCGWAHPVLPPPYALLFFCSLCHSTLELWKKRVGRTAMINRGTDAVLWGSPIFPPLSLCLAKNPFCLITSIFSLWLLLPRLFQGNYTQRLVTFARISLNNY